MPGHCPNPKGRPKKKPKIQISQSDLQHFGNTIIEVVTNGQRQTIDRRTALLQKMFESAMKGSVSMQRYLHQEFKKNDEMLAAARVRFDDLQTEWIFNNPDFKKPDFQMPFEVEMELLNLQALLHHYYPLSYRDPGLLAVNDDEE